MASVMPVAFGAGPRKYSIGSASGSRTATASTPAAGHNTATSHSTTTSAFEPERDSGVLEQRHERREEQRAEDQRKRH